MASEHPYNEPFDPRPRDPFSSRAGVDSATPINAAGIFGLVFSLFGLLTCGLFSPVALVVSLLAMRKEPRVAAIAGVIISLVGMLLMLLIAGLLLIGMAMYGHGNIGYGGELLWDNAMIQVHIEEYGTIPQTLAELNLPAGMETDPWGNPYVYTVFPDGLDYKLETMGPDGIYGTSDDRVLYPQ
jgi:hypothetical protein